MLHRRVKNQRLAATGYLWAFSAISTSPGARAHYDRRKNDGDRHAAAQRNLFGRLLGCLHHCLTTRAEYDETTAFPAAAGKLPQADDNLTASDVWQAGNGALANIAIARTLEADPGYTMALLLAEAMRHGLPPSAARPPMTPEEVAASYGDTSEDKPTDNAESTSPAGPTARDPVADHFPD